MAGSKHGRYANVKLTPTHFARIPLPKPKVEDKPIPDDERIVAPIITAPGRTEGSRQTLDEEGREWFILSAEPGRERRLRTGLIDLGYSAYLPTETVWVRLSRAHPRAKRELQRPILHRYVFLGRRPDQPWYPLYARDETGRNSLGIVGILGSVSENCVTPVSVHDVAALAARERQGFYDERKRVVLERGAAELARPKVEKSEMARVTEGPFAGFNGRAAHDATSNGVRLALDIFGRETFVLIPLENVENLERETSHGAKSLRGPLIPQKNCA